MRAHTPHTPSPLTPHLGCSRLRQSSEASSWMRMRQGVWSSKRVGLRSNMLMKRFLSVERVNGDGIGHLRMCFP